MSVIQRIEHPLGSEGGKHPVLHVSVQCGTSGMDFQITDQNANLVASFYLAYHDGMVKIAVDDIETMDEPLVLVKLTPTVIAQVNEEVDVEEWGQ